MVWVPTDAVYVKLRKVLHRLIPRRVLSELGVNLNVPSVDYFPRFHDDVFSVIFALHSEKVLSVNGETAGSIRTFEASLRDYKAGENFIIYKYLLRIRGDFLYKICITQTLPPPVSHPF
ncbi:Uncharacterised protein [Mycobacteroides abscessus subsp. massiliense]|nr:Uncharacterised protein [Mycobacteroides abscessus subsp. massiliense]